MNIKHYVKKKKNSAVKIIALIQLKRIDTVNAELPFLIGGKKDLNILDWHHHGWWLVIGRVPLVGPLQSVGRFVPFLYNLLPSFLVTQYRCG